MTILEGMAICLLHRMTPRKTGSERSLTNHERDGGGSCRPYLATFVEENMLPFLDFFLRLFIYSLARRIAVLILAELGSDLILS